MATQEYSREAEDRYEVENDNSVDVSGDIKDSSYVHPETKSHLPIQSDDAPVDDPIDVSTSNTDQQLGLLISPLVLMFRTSPNSSPQPKTTQTQLINPI